VVARNDDWEATQSSDILAATNASGAFAFARGSKDSAVLLELAPGVYTVTVSGAGGATGIALVEAYEVLSR
jgi:hypothetical protein